MIYSTFPSVITYEIWFCLLLLYKTIILLLSAVKDNPPARNIDAVKRRTRAGMGRCQGGFCQPHVAEIIARELGIPFEQVTKNGKGSELVTGVSK